MKFEKGSDLSPLKWEGDCNCRIYQLRFRVSREDLFDDLERIVHPLHPRTFNLATGEDFRKALGEIVRDLEKL